MESCSTESRIDNSITNDDMPKLPKILDGKYYEIVQYDKENDLTEAKYVKGTKKEVFIRGSKEIFTPIAQKSIQSMLTTSFTIE